MEIFHPSVHHPPITCSQTWLAKREACLIGFGWFGLRPGSLGMSTGWLGLIPGWLGKMLGWPGQRAGWLGLALRSGRLGLRPGWSGLRPGWLGLGPAKGGGDEQTGRKAPHLWSFVPYQGRCPISNNQFLGYFTYVQTESLPILQDFVP